MEQKITLTKKLTLIIPLIYHRIRNANFILGRKNDQKSQRNNVEAKTNLPSKKIVFIWER